ncbi:MAG: rRNA pseudouridine synthase [Clostridia bacterium]|nr:rRNA pseudouridine synthase [Clostridia bacterium]
MRINKYVAECGVASRRGADELILNGRISVNGKKVTELGLDVSEKDVVYFDGKRIRPVSRYSYLMLYKPKGCICSARDEHGRKTVYDYVELDKKLSIVGRLDYDSEGLLLLTNDGDLVNKLTHPSFEVPKTYIVKVEGEVSEAEIQRLSNSMDIGRGEQTKGAKVTLLDVENRISRLEITISEGKNREIRRMMESIGKNVIFLKRVAIGDLRLGGLSRGKTRYLNDKEIKYLKSL